MNKKTAILWIIFALFLVLLYIVSGTDLIIKENEEKAYSAAILIDEISEENYKNIKKGLEDAAYEYNVELKFPNITYDTSVDEQVEIINEEIELGVNAVIIGTDKKDGVARKIRSEHPEIPILLVGESVVNEINSVLPDYDEIAGLIVGNVIRQSEKVKKIYLVTGKHKNSSLENRLREDFYEKGSKVEVIELNDRNIEMLFRNSTAVLIGVDKEASMELVKYSENSEKRPEIYAIGATSHLLNELEDRNIKGIAAYNEYYFGYFMLERVINPSGKVRKDKIPVFYLKADDLKNEKYMKILYPVE